MRPSQQDLNHTHLYSRVLSGTMPGSLLTDNQCRNKGAMKTEAHIGKKKTYLNLHIILVIS